MQVSNIRGPSTTLPKGETLRVKTLYRVQVRAKNSDGVSGWSEPIYVYVTEEPPKAESHGSISILPNIASYELYGYRPNNEFAYIVCLVPEQINSNLHRIATVVESWGPAAGKSRDTNMVNVRKGRATSDSDCDPPQEEDEVGHDAIIFVDNRIMEDNECWDLEPSASCWRSLTMKLTRLLFFTGNLDHLLEVMPGWLLVRETRTPDGSVTDWNESAHNSACNILEHVIVHEVGHALGRGGIAYESEHAALTHSSLMSTADPEATDPTPYCTPQAYDTAVLMANYQSR